MATDSDLDSCELGKKAKAIRIFPPENGSVYPFSPIQDSSSFNGINVKTVKPSKKIQEYNFDLLSTRSGSEFRFINSAIYAESFETDDDRGDHVGEPVKHFDQSSTKSETVLKHEQDLLHGFPLLSISNSSSTIEINGDHAPGTYRCFPSIISSTSSSQNSSRQQSRPVKRIERRCKINSDLSSSLESKSLEDLSSPRLYETKNVQRCSLNGFGTIQSSTSSFSTTILSERTNGIPSSRQLAHEEWIREKERKALELKEEKRRVEKIRKMEEERIKEDKEEKERIEHETFVRWVERKKQEEAIKQEVLKKELELQKRLKDIEDKAVVAKTIYLRQWARKKEEDHKVQHKKQQLVEQQKEEEKKKRVEESNKAYDVWREKSKTKAKPATQGLLPHQKAKPAFVNPNPWQNLIEIEDEQDQLSKCRTEKIKPQKLDGNKSKKRTK